jgi:hypothetical protein
MADVAGSLLTSPVPLGSAKPDKRRGAYYLTTTLPLGAAKPDKRREGVSINIGTGGGTTVTNHYKLRARDNGLGPPAVYTEWESTDYLSNPTATPVGAWVEKTILAYWTT